MPRAKKAKFVPKKKKTLVAEPKWEQLRKAKSEEERYKAFITSSEFVHFEVADREQLHWLKKWIREISDWDLHEGTVKLPDVYMMPFAKYGWLAVKLEYMPKKVENSFVKNLKPLLERAEEIKKDFADDGVYLPEDKEHFIHPDKVKKWLSEWKTYLKGIENFKDSKDAKQRITYQTAQTYVQNMTSYLRTGIWNDSHFGANREGKVMFVVKALAYDNEGMVKRTKGHYYPDIGKVW